MSQGWHIWLVTDVYPPDCGGSGWSTHALATTLIENGNQVEVIGIDPESTLLTQRLYEGVPVTELGVGAARRSPRRRLGVRDYVYHALYEYLAERLVDEPGVDILHAQHLHSGPPSLAVARRFDRGAVLTLRDYWPVCLHGTSWWGGDVCPGCTTERLVGCMGEYWGWPRAAARLMVGWANRRLAARRDGVSRAHEVVAVSEALRGRVELDLAGVGFAVVPNIVDAAASEAAAAGAEEQAARLMPEGVTSPFLLTAGKLEPTKGFDLLLAALADAGTPWPVVVAGAGSARSALERQAGRAGLPVHFLGSVEHVALLSLLRGARALLLPSAWNEPLSRLLLESMALGTPVVAWDRGGNPEVLETDRNGWLVRGAGDLTVALSVLGTEEGHLRLSEGARDRARQLFSPAVVYPRLATLYETAATAAGRRREPAAGSDETASTAVTRVDPGHAVPRGS